MTQKTLKTENLEQETTPEIQETTPVQETTPENQEQSSKQKKQKVDPGKYSRYVALKFAEISGTKLKEQQKKELESLEKEIKSCSGKKPNKTTTAAISNELVKLVEGAPVPEFIEKLIDGCINPNFYFG
jgi:hypothetical protein